MRVEMDEAICEMAGVEEAEEEKRGQGRWETRRWRTNGKWREKI